MNRFFFITSYDQISGEILASLVNIHPDIHCDTLRSYFFADILYSTIDQYIEKSSIKTKKFSGSIAALSAPELQQKIDKDKPKHPFRKADIKISPLLRIRFILMTWLNSGFTSEQLIAKLERQLSVDMLKSNNVAYYYQHILNTVLTHLQHYQNNPHLEKPKNLFEMATPKGKLFIFALAIVLAFDAANNTYSGKCFHLEKLLTNQGEFSRLIHYITYNESTFSAELESQFNLKLQDAFKILNDAQNITIEPWQIELLNNCRVNFKIMCS